MGTDQRGPIYNVVEYLAEPPVVFPGPGTG